MREEFCLRLLMLVTTQLRFVAFVSSAETTPIATRDGGVVSCPVSKPCACERTDGRLVLNCRQHNLDRVPAFSHSDELVDELTLAMNHITKLPGNAFRGLRVRRLVLTNNQLTNVSSAAFAGLEPHLKELRIQLHPAAEFPSEAVRPLTQLRVLDVVGYSGSSLPGGALASLGLLHELRLTPGRLSRLSSGDVAAMRETLSVIDLSGNPLGAVPTAALVTLSNLTEVILSGCNIARIGARAFASSTRLRRLDLSQNQLEVVDADAFRGDGVTGLSVRELSIRSSHLSDAHLSALLALTQLRKLDIALNGKITGVDRLLDTLRSLETLDASFDGVSSLTSPVSSSTLRVLNLADNPLINVATDAFVGLTALQELRLDGARLTLGNDSFASQRLTLRTLSLRQCNFTRAPWPSIAGLSALETLVLSQSGLRSIPDFTFMDVGRLRYLDLKDNSLQQVTQRSLAGLHAHLETITLDNNQLTTLDHCVFYRFNNIDFLKLGLANNPLRCVCGLHWLFKTLQDETFYYTRWRCADVGKMFNEIVDADFDGCGGVGSTAVECEDLIPTTTPSAIYPTDGRLEVMVAATTDSTVTVEWLVAAEVDVLDQEITHQEVGSNVTVRLPLAATQRSHVIIGLAPNTAFNVCVELTAGDNESSAVVPVVSCSPATTTPDGGRSSWLASMELIIGVSVGGGLAVVIVLSVAVYCCCAASRRRRLSVSSSAPRRSGQTKRFRKQGTNVYSPPGGERTSNRSDATPAEVDRAIVESVERLDPYSKEVLANLLRSASAYSLDHIGGTSNYPSPSSGADQAPDDRPTSTTDRHFYEHLPDDTYDQIPTDEFV